VSKFSAEVPKGDGWGIEEVVQEIVEEIIAGNKSRMVPVMGVIDVKEVKLDPESGTHIAVVRVRRLEAITSIERARKAQKMILEQVAERRGEGTMLPFEEKDILDRAFGGTGDKGVTVGIQLQDDEEKTIDAELDDGGRLRRHLVAVHDFDAHIVTDDEATTADVERAHEAEHAKDPADRAWPDHDPESRMWRRVDLVDILGDSEEPAETEEESVAIVDANLRAMGGEGLTDPDQAEEDADANEGVDPDEDEDPEGHGIRRAEDVMQENADADGTKGLIPEFRDSPDDPE